MVTSTMDPRTEAVQRAADNLCHVFCDNCWVPGMPMMCGKPDNPEEAIHEDCDCPTCPMCEMEWARHLAVDC